MQWQEGGTIILSYISMLYERWNEGGTKEGLNMGSLLADPKGDRGRVLEIKQIKSAKNLRVYKKSLCARNGNIRYQ